MEDPLESVVEFEYLAMEPRYGRLRLAHQPKSGAAVYVIGFDGDRYTMHTAPYSIALAGDLYDDFMNTLEINEMELLWLRSLAGLAAEYS